VAGQGRGRQGVGGLNFQGRYLGPHYYVVVLVEIQCRLWENRVRVWISKGIERPLILDRGLT